MTVPGQDEVFQAGDSQTAAVKATIRILNHFAPELVLVPSEYRWTVTGHPPGRQDAFSSRWRVDLTDRDYSVFLASIIVTVARVDGSPNQWRVESAEIDKLGPRTEGIPIGQVDLRPIDFS